MSISGGQGHITGGTVPSAQDEFIELNDTPASYSGESLKAVRVNSGETALEFIDLDTLYLRQDNNLSDLDNVGTARTNLGLVAGGAGDIWVEKAGDTMTGDLTIAKDAPQLIFEDTGGTIDWTLTNDADDLTIAPSSLSTAASEKLVVNAPLNLSGSLPEGFSSTLTNQIDFNYDQTSGSGIAHQVQSIGVRGTLTYIDTIPIYRGYMVQATFSNEGGGTVSRWELFNSFSNLITPVGGGSLWGHVTYNSQNKIQNDSGESKTLTFNADGSGQAAVSFWARDSYESTETGSVTTISEHNGFRSDGGTGGTTGSVTVTDWNDFRIASLSTANVSTTITNRNNLYIPDNTDTDITNVNGIRSFINSNSGANLLIKHTGDAAIELGGELRLLADNTSLVFGAGEDADIYYDGTNLVLDAQAAGSGHIILNSPKTTTGDPTGVEGKIYWNTVDNVIKMYADGAWRTLASW